MVQATVEKKVNDALTARLREGRADLETLPNGHVCGHVISPEFEGLSYQDRYRRINEILERELNQDELIQVSTLLTYTPKEWEFEPEHN